MVEDRLPYGAGVRCFPDPAIHAAKEEFSMASWHAAHGNNATCAKRADESPLQSAVESGRQRLRRNQLCGG